MKEIVKNIATLFIAPAVIAAIVAGVFSLITTKHTNARVENLESIKHQYSIIQLKYERLEVLLNDINTTKEVDYTILGNDDLTAAVEEYHRYLDETISLSDRARALLSKEALLKLGEFPHLPEDTHIEGSDEDKVFMLGAWKLSMYRTLLKEQIVMEMRSLFELDE